MDSKILKPLMDEGWYNKLKPFFESEDFDKIVFFLKERKKQGKSIVPIDTEFLNAFKYCKYSDLKVVILGMDPYHSLHNGQPVACGLSFGSALYNYIPPSLKNIINEVEDDVYKGLNLDTFLDEKNGEYTLAQWAEQGVLLFNTALTTEVGIPGAHCEIWRPFTNYVLELLNNEQKGMIFMLWGEKAKGYKNFIDGNRHYILEAGHPSPLNTSEKKFKGCKHFSQANALLKLNNGEGFQIRW